MSLVKIKDFNALIDNKLFFDQPVKIKQKAYEKLIKMYFENYCNIISIDLSRKKKNFSKYFFLFLLFIFKYFISLKSISQILILQES